MSAGNGAKTAMQMVQEARSRIETLTPEQVQEELKKGVLLVDLRETEERAQHGSIPGALHLPRGMLEFCADPSSPLHRTEFEPQKRVILHCAKGMRSALATDTLRQLGYTSAAHMDGGFERWRQEQRPVISAQGAA